MALIGRLIKRLLKQGSITIVAPDGERQTYGPDGGRGADCPHRGPQSPLARVSKNPRPPFSLTDVDPWRVLATSKIHSSGFRPKRVFAAGPP